MLAEKKVRVGSIEVITIIARQYTAKKKDVYAWYQSGMFYQLPMGDCYLSPVHQNQNPSLTLLLIPFFFQSHTSSPVVMRDLHVLVD